MNASSILMLIIFVVIGYVAHPLVLPLVEDKLPKAEASIGDHAEELVEKVGNQPVELIPAARIEPSVPVVVEKSVVNVTPRIVEESTEPEPMVEEIVEESVVEARTGMNEVQVIAAMQKSVKAGEVNAFGYDEVEAWQISGDEEFKGFTYTVGLAYVRTTTILGLTEQKVKALCSGGAVVAWLWEASGLEVE